MKRIFKYPLSIVNIQEIEMPENASILSVGNQMEEMFIWAEVEEERVLVSYRILILGTGHIIPVQPTNTNRQFIGSVQMAGGTLIWHVFLINKI